MIYVKSLNRLFDLFQDAKPHMIHASVIRSPTNWLLYIGEDYFAWVYPVLREDVPDSYKESHPTEIDVTVYLIAAYAQDLLDTIIGERADSRVFVLDGAPAFDPSLAYPVGELSEPINLLKQENK